MVSAAICDLVVIFAGMNRTTCKISVLLLAVGLLLTVACRNNIEYPRELTKVDSLTNENRLQEADSLLRIYSPEAMKADESVRMYYQLLRLRTDDKLSNYPLNDSIALALVSYYEHRGDKRLLPKAYYYAGRVYAELYDAPQALEYFQKAAEELDKYEDNSIASKVYSQIGQIFQKQHLPSMALPYFRKSLKIDSIRQDTLGLIFNYRDIAFQYDKMHNDSAVIYYKSALELAKLKGYSFLINSVNMCISSFLEEKNQAEEAYKYIQVALHDTEKEEMGSTYVVAGKIYDDLGLEDSAAIFFKEVLTIGNCYAKETAAWRLSKIAQTKGDIQSSRKYLEEYRKQNDSVNAVNHAEAIVLTQSMYNYQLQEKAKTLAEKNNEKKKRIIIILITALALAVIIIVAITEYNKKKRTISNLRLIELNRVLERQKRESVQFIENNNKQIEILNLELSKVQDELVKSQIENQRLILLADNIKAEEAMKMKNLSQKKLRDSEVFIKLKNNIRHELAAKDEDLLNLEATINEVYPTFIEKLTRLVNMNNQDFRICLLTKAGFKPLEISKLTSHSPQAISTSRKRLYKKIFGKEGSPNDWDEYIKSIVS